MGLFDKLTGTKRPADGVALLPPQAVRAALLALSGPDVPWVVRDGAKEGADLVAEWRILEPAWRTFFVRTQVSELLQIRMRLVPDKREVRAVDQMWEVTWAGETPRVAISAEASRGHVTAVSTRWTYERGADGRRRKVETFRFDSAEIKTPLQKVVLGAGWTWRGAVFKL